MSDWRLPMLRPMLFVALAVFAVGAPAQSTNPQIDYPGFEKLTGSVPPYRQSRLLSWAKFSEAAARPGALILDARSADAYAAGHIRGAVNLPFTDFTEESLAEVIGDKSRPILIYCNNNFSNDRPSGDDEVSPAGAEHPDVHQSRRLRLSQRVGTERSRRLQRPEGRLGQARRAPA